MHDVTVIIEEGVKVEKRFLLYVDLLGFSRRVCESTFVETWGHYETVMKIVEVSVMKTGLKDQVNYEFVSDSLFFWSADGRPQEDAFRDLIRLGVHVMSNCVRHGIFLRGSFVYDEFYIDHYEHVLFIRNNNPNDGFITKKVHTILGKGVVRAAGWEKDQKWCGISLPIEDYATLKSSFPQLQEAAQQDGWLYEYDVPTKSSGNQRTLVFTFAFESVAAISMVKYHFEKTNVTSAQAGPKQYATETLRFIDQQVSAGINPYSRFT